MRCRSVVSLPRTQESKHASKQPVPALHREYHDPPRNLSAQAVPRHRRPTNAAGIFIIIRRRGARCASKLQQARSEECCAKKALRQLRKASRHRGAEAQPRRKKMKRKTRRGGTAARCKSGVALSVPFLFSPIVQFKVRRESARKNVNFCELRAKPISP